MPCHNGQPKYQRECALFLGYSASWGVRGWMSSAYLHFWLPGMGEIAEKASRHPGVQVTKVIGHKRRKSSQQPGTLPTGYKYVILYYTVEAYVEDPPCWRLFPLLPQAGEPAPVRIEENSNILSTWDSVYTSGYSTLGKFRSLEFCYHDGNFCTLLLLQHFSFRGGCRVVGRVVSRTGDSNTLELY